MKAIVLLSVFICGFYAITAQQSSTQSVPASSSAIPAPPNRTEGSNGAWVRVLGRSGRIIIGRNADPDTDSNGIVLGFESLTEVDAQGNAIMISDHYLTNFGRTDFRFGSTREYMFQGLNTRHFDFAARVQMTYDAMLLIKVYIFRDSGNVTMDNETIPVGRGDIKFSVDIQNWRFCGAAGVRACVSGSQNLIGDGLDLVMSIRGQRSEGPRERNEDERRARRIRGGRDFDLGGRNSIVLSTKVKYDGQSAYEDMEDGYPMLRRNNSNSEFVFRFRRFNTSASYDPTIELGSELPNGGSSIHPILITIITPILFLMTIVLQKLNI